MVLVSDIRRKCPAQAFFAQEDMTVGQDAEFR